MEEKLRPLMHTDPTVPEMAAHIYHLQACLDRLLNHAKAWDGFDTNAQEFHVFLAQVPMLQKLIDDSFAAITSEYEQMIVELAEYLDRVGVRYP